MPYPQHHLDDKQNLSDSHNHLNLYDRLDLYGGLYHDLNDDLDYGTQRQLESCIMTTARDLLT